MSCETGEVFVSAYCLGSGAPVFRAGAEGALTASCPGGSDGMVGACTRP